VVFAQCTTNIERKFSYFELCRLKKVLKWNFCCCFRRSRH